MIAFFLGGLPLAAIFFAFNVATFGHPLRTGYESTGHFSLMRLTGFTTRFDFYVYWLVVTMSPFLPFGWLAVGADRRVHWRHRALLITWFGAFLLFYSCYDIYDPWWYTRFLLPAYPAMIIGALLTARDLSGLGDQSVVAHERARLSGMVVVSMLLAASLVCASYQTLRLDVLTVGGHEAVSPASCRWADDLMPKSALVVSMEMSGALKFYTRRSIVRWDAVTADQWPTLKRRAAERGDEWYALLHPHEVAEAQRHLPGKWNQMGMFRHISLWKID